MKRLLSTILIVIILITALAACTPKDSAANRGTNRPDTTAGATKK